MVLRAAVRGLDSLLRRCYGIHEFSHDPDCLLRVSLGRARRDLTLGDGASPAGGVAAGWTAVIKRGDPVAELHLWNERMPAIAQSGPTLSWAVAMRRRLGRSMEFLADIVDGQDPADEGPPLGRVRAFHAVGTFPKADSIKGLAGRLGFQIVPPPPVWEPWRRFTVFWENLFNQVLVWVYNPASLRTRSFDRLAREELWMSRETFDRMWSRARRRG